MIDKQFIVDDINDFLKPNNNKWKTYFDKAECRTILDAIEKSNKYEKMVKAWDEVLEELEERIRNEVKLGCESSIRSGSTDNHYVYATIYDNCIDIINQKLEEIDK